MIKAKKLNEAGYKEAILGFSIAMKPRSADLAAWWTTERFVKVEKTALVNAPRGKGHNKFLRAIQTWWHLDLPRFFSQEHATYKVGTTTLSASTMHRITYEPVTMNCFDYENLLVSEYNALECIIASINMAVERKDLLTAKRLLPESYMLEQVWCANYAVLRTIIEQRHDHRLKGWQELISAFLTQCDHPELLNE